MAQNIAFSYYNKIYLVHFVSHKLVAVMHVSFADKPFGAVAHPKLDNFSFYRFVADRSKSVTKLIGNNSIGQRFFHNVKCSVV